MPYDWKDDYIESKADKRTDSLGFGEIGGVGQLIYHIFRYKAYEVRTVDYGAILAFPVCTPEYAPGLLTDGAYTGRDLLASLCNLAKKIDDFSEKKSFTELIADWCTENAHPYAIDFIYRGLTDKAFDIKTDGDLIAKDGVFSISDFMTDLGKLYNAARFYVAMESICKGDEEPALHLYNEGRYFEGYPFFEEFKRSYEMPDIDYGSAKGDLLKEMQLDAEYRKKHQPPLDEIADTFVREPFEHYEELRDILAESIPDFRMRLKVNPATNRLVFSADINSVFDIGWYTLARMVSEDPAPEDIGYEDEPPEGIMICCHNCGAFMIRRNNRQEYCDNPECQRARNARNQKNYRQRQRLAKMQREKDDK